MMRERGRASTRAGRILGAVWSCLVLCAAYPGEVGAQGLVLGPEVVASVDRDGGSLRVEPSVILADSVVVTAWNDSRTGRDFGVRIGVGVAWSYSVDSGRTFRFGGYLPNPGAEGISSPAAADSWLVDDGAGTIYLQILHWPDEGDHQIRVYALSTGNPSRMEFRGIAAAGPRVDKPAMTAGPDGRLWIGYSDHNRIFVVRSEDGGRSWSAPVLVSEDHSGMTRSGADVSVCGGRVVVAWVEEKRQAEAAGGEDAEGGGGVWIAMTAADATDLAPPVPVHPMTSPLPVPPGYSLGLGQMSRIPNNAWLACRSGTERADRLLLAFAAPVDHPDGVGSVAMRMSASTGTGALRWEGPDPVSVGVPGLYQAFPAIAPTPHGAAVAYYDWRHASEQAGTDVYLSLETGRDTRDVRVTTASTRWPDLPGDPDHAVIQRNVGDYLALAADGHRLAVAWTDGRSGRSQVMVRIVEIR